jgi:hypothetical protein
MLQPRAADSRDEETPMTDQDRAARAVRRLTAVSASRASDDPTLAAMSAALAADGDRDADRDGGGDLHAAPFDLGVPAPRAVDLRALWKLAGKDADPMILATLGPRTPILLSHAVTAFPAPGRPPRVWGIRYASSLFGVDATTVDLAPTSEQLDILQLDATADFRVSLGGELEVSPPALAAVQQVPGISLNAAKVGGSIDEKATLRINFTMSVPKVIAGPDASGGARWQLYAQDRALNGQQALLQTVLIPAGVRTLRVEVVASVAAAGWFGPKEWTYETASFQVSLDGLSPD